MTIGMIMTEVSRLGITLSARDGKIFARPLSAVPPDLVDEIRQHKSELLTMLSEPYFRAQEMGSRAEAAGRDLTDYLREHAADLLDEHDDHGEITPAQSILVTCRKHGISLRLDEAGCLVVSRAGLNGKEPVIWPTLIDAIKAHLDAVIELVAGGNLRAVSSHDGDDSNLGPISMHRVANGSRATG